MKITCLAASFMAVLSLLSSCTAQKSDLGLPQVLYDDVYGRLRFKAMLVSSGQLSQEAALAIAIPFVRSINLSTFSQLLIVEDESDLRLSTLGTVPAIESEPSFERTVEQLKAAVKDRAALRPVARVVAFGGAALFSYREGGQGRPDQPGVYESIVAGNHDPTQIMLKEGHVRLLVLAVGSGTQPGYINVDSFFKDSEELSCSACRELADYTQALSGGYMVSIQVRPDVWFASLTFPLLFRFEADNRQTTYSNFGDRIVPPKVDRFYETPHTKCLFDSGGFTCRRYGLRESVP